MSVTYKNLAINDSISGTSAGSPDTLYTCTNGSAQINQATVKNADPISSVTVHFYILPSGSSATGFSPVWSQEVAAGQSDFIDGLIGHVIPKGASIQAYASATADAKVTISGVEIV